ncbi:MAG TPA: methyltransferase domain-containing protein [Solirubrobacteraceae bacterium]|nr:methyltransferase domain-containing protein [Solirubrobacteraceae bacterium]
MPAEEELQAPATPAPASDGPHQLNIGAGHTYIPGFVNIDISERADVTLDLSIDRLPFADDSVSTIISVWTLEHIPNYLFALSELHRVLRHDGALLLKLPYVTLTESHLINPYHLHNFSERSFDFFDPLRLKGSAAEEQEIAFRKAFVNYTYMGYFGALPAAMRVWARRHLLNVVRQFDIGLVALKDPERPVDVGPARARELQLRLGDLDRRRVPYPLADGERPLAPRGTAQERRPPWPRRVRRVIRRRTKERSR